MSLYIHLRIRVLLCVASSSFISGGKFGSSYLGKATAAARAAPPIPNSACGILVRPNKTWLPVLGIFNVHTMLMRAIAQEGCRDTVRESALKVSPGRKIPCRTGESNLL